MPCHKLLRARNPELDIIDGNIAIDFGTSSTVVAYRHQGSDKLLRFGENDMWALSGSNAFENPTIMEIINWKHLMDAWTSEAYRPLLDWADIHCSHEALSHFRDNQTDTKVIGSVLYRLKQWALRVDQELQIVDQANGDERILPSLQNRSPVRGQAISVSENDPFDPIELYAWFLGMNINWRQRGIFLRYYMTFPVDYPVDIKNKILFSFRRGLQRSLPDTLLDSPRFAEFNVEEWAAEPTAYAASALSVLNLQPTKEGCAYAVFDFGGGTTDFDFGYFRLPNESELEEADWEAVLEHFGAAGDGNLGGENLLENMAYLVFRHNLSQCEEHEISFQKPLDAEDFPSSEMYLDNTQAAKTNTLVLISQLRSYWETGDSSKLVDGAGMLGLKLISSNDNEVTTQFSIPVEELRSYLENRIWRGVEAFFIAMKAAFEGAGGLPEQVHVLLAGNSSRSDFVLDLFGTYDGEASTELYERTQELLVKLFPSSFVEDGITVHPPLEQNLDDPYQATAKTGVALGLLRICRGEPVKVINRAIQDAEGEAPFQYFMGRLLREKFEPRLLQHGKYRHWHEIGRPMNGVFNLVYTDSPRARTGLMERNDPDLNYKRLELTGNVEGQKIFVRAIAPDQVELCIAPDIAHVDNPAIASNYRFIKLT